MGEVNRFNAAAYNQHQLNIGRVTMAHVTTLVEFWQEMHKDLVVDGKCGPKTRHSLEGGTVIVGMLQERAIPRWPKFEGPLKRLPQSRREVYEIFGNPGAGKLDKKWAKENLVRCVDMPGVPPRRWPTKVHRLAEPYLREALRRAQEAAPDYKIEKFWCHNYRLQRFTNRLSYHSWGIAVDINPEENFAKEYPHGHPPPKPWGYRWYKTWPRGIPRAFVEAFESVGWSFGGYWGGRVKDPMHLELIHRGS